MTIRNFNDKIPQIADSAFIDETALVIGDVHIGADSGIWPTAVIRGDINIIRIGQRTNIQDGSVLHVNHAGLFNPEGDPLIIGNDVTVGHRVILHGCTLNDRCLIGMGCIIMDKAIINTDVLVGAGSLVPPGKELSSGYLYVGNPVKKVRALTEKELKYFHYSAKHYAQLKDLHRANH